MKSREDDFYEGLVDTVLYFNNKYGKNAAGHFLKTFEKLSSLSLNSNDTGKEYVVDEIKPVLDKDEWDLFFKNVAIVKHTYAMVKKYMGYIRKNYDQQSIFKKLQECGIDHATTEGVHKLMHYDIDSDRLWDFIISCVKESETLRLNKYFPKTKKSEQPTNDNAFVWTPELINEFMNEGEEHYYDWSKEIKRFATSKLIEQAKRNPIERDGTFIAPASLSEHPQCKKADKEYHAGDEVSFEIMLPDMITGIHLNGKIKECLNFKKTATVQYLNPFTAKVELRDFEFDKLQSPIN